MNPPRLVSLFDFTGNWPSYFALDGYDVELVDIKHGVNIFDWEPDSRPVWGILAAPPCTHFSSSGAQYFKAKDADGRTAEGLRLIDRCLDLIDKVKPRFWVLENPIGRLPRLRPERLGKARMIVQPYMYAGYAPDPSTDAYPKSTCLWGNFEMGPTAPVEPVYHTIGKWRGSWQWAKLGGKSERTKTLRSTTPLGFAYATWLGNRSPAFGE